MKLATINVQTKFKKARKRLRVDNFCHSNVIVVFIFFAIKTQISAFVLYNVFFKLQIIVELSIRECVKNDVHLEC